MSKIHWKSRKTLGFLSSVVVLYLIIRVKQYQYDASVFIPKVVPSVVWEFVADFSNMKYLNPTITDFNIIDESGNYDHWKYSTEYWETLSHWPHLPNHAIAHFEVKAFPKNSTYIITSIHKTCLLSGFYCLDSRSEFKFTEARNDPGTLCQETVLYKCPVIMSSFCRREVIFQRNAIMKNLHNKFLTY